MDRSAERQLGQVATEPTEPSLLLSSEGMDVVELRGLLLVRCHPAVCVNDLDALRERLSRLQARRPQGMSMLFIVHARIMGLLDHGRRSACVELAMESEPLLRSKAYVVEGGEAAVGEARAAVSTIDMLAGSRVPTGVFRDVPSALGWLALTDPAVTRGDLMALRTLLGSSV